MFEAYVLNRLSGRSTRRTTVHAVTLAYTQQFTHGAAYCAETQPSNVAVCPFFGGDEMQLASFRNDERLSYHLVTVSIIEERR